jgi:hypothetical protein
LKISQVRTAQGGSATMKPPVPRIDWARVMAFRTRRHHLHRRTPKKTMLEVVASICGLQAQLMSSVQLAMWTRIEGLTLADVRDALWKHRRLVKTWAMRGTLHVLHADDYLRWQRPLGAYAHHTKPGWLQRCGLTPQELDEAVSAIGRALGRRLLTREQLANEVTRVLGTSALGDILRQGWGFMLKPAAFHGQLCFAPSIGVNVRFARPDVWLRRAPRPDSHGGWIDLTCRFLAAYGPATRVDYSRWSGAPLALADAMLRSLGPEVSEISLAGAQAWVLSEDVKELVEAERSGSVRLLPAFDQYVIAASPHVQNLISAGRREDIFRPQGWISPVLLVDGRIDGVWSYQRNGPRLAVRIGPFVRLTRRVQSAVEVEAEGLAKFFDAELELKQD